ncbi:unnamed protein product [Rotaria socialis]|uniref:F-box domain-containing protein n=2 Tax=Rotaria TaxID=231623 RepID=A0A821V183_9BILA|nr:unnamed protein product [Rotaria socialis]CAF4898673.1 unnamed protein product [Rotaria socialis]
MEHLFSPLMYLPDEILMIILSNLHNMDVLYSLIGVNNRLDQIARDPYFTTQLALIKYNSSRVLTSSLSDLVLHRFCLHILPQICYKVKWFKLETLSMERILLAANYPNLNRLDILIMDQETDINLFNNESPLAHIFQNQIKTLSISGRKSIHDVYPINMRGKLFSHIFIMFTNLLYLKFYQSNIGTTYISFNHQCPEFLSSTLVELHINVYYFDDCLYLLDGRLHQLRSLSIKAFHILPLQSSINQKNELSDLRCFSLTCDNKTFVYNEVIKPNLQRMSNLEKLALYLVIDYNEAFIDGNYLMKSIISHMPHLNEFIFNIRSIIFINNLAYLPSSDDVQRSFIKFDNHKIISCVDYFPKEQIGQCHIYSYPYTPIYYENLTNNFPGGLFNCVKIVEIFDERPFEHEFFIRIAQAFPFLQDLTITNMEAQQQKSDDSNRHVALIEYSYLAKLHLLSIHDDYAEQFLLDTKTCLPNNIHLIIDYDILQRVTQNLTRDATRINYSKVERLSAHHKVDLSKYL